MKVKQFKKLSEKKYIMELGSRTIKLSFDKPTPYYPKVHKIQNKINRLIIKDKFILARQYEKIKQKKKLKFLFKK